MMTTTTEATPEDAIAQLEAKRAAGLAAYVDYCRAVARGKATDVGELETILRAADKTTDEFRQDVHTHRHRDKLRADIARRDSLTEQAAAKKTELDAIDAAHAEVVAKHQADTRPLRIELRDLNDERNRINVQQLRFDLAKGCEDDDLRRAVELAKDRTAKLTEQKKAAASHLATLESDQINAAESGSPIRQSQAAGEIARAVERAKAKVAELAAEIAEHAAAQKAAWDQQTEW